MNRRELANVWGHRGCRGPDYPPENSLRAFEHALECGVGGIEFDVRLSKDGVPVVFHDDKLERMTGKAGEVSSYTAAELKSFRLTGRERIPTLDEVLDSADSWRKETPFVLNIELKDPHAVAPVAQAVGKKLAGGWGLRDFSISSFDLNCLTEIKKLLPGVPIGALFECGPGEIPQRLEQIRELLPDTINIPLESLTHAVLHLIRERGASAIVWIPGEASPFEMGETERERLMQRLHEREFTLISDFPREVLQCLRPSKARATATGVLAACLAFSENDMVFRPSESGLEDLKSPGDYPELKRFGFRELRLKAEDAVEFTVWERKGYRDRPHFLLFHGNRAHWGDTGPGDPQRDRRARLKFIEELASTGAGVTAVTLRGFGKSSALPSEIGFVRDIRAVAEHLAALDIGHRRIVVAGESLGTWAAVQAAALMTLRNRPPALVSLQNPFTCMAEVGERVISHYPIVRSLSIHLSASSIDRNVLKNHFYTANLLSAIQPCTAIYLATSGKDDLVNPSHSDKLAEIAKNNGLTVVRDLYPDALHHNIPPVEFARRVGKLGVQYCAGTSDCAELWGESFGAATHVDQMPYL